MRNITVTDFLTTHKACSYGEKFAVQFVTMYDVYEALLRGEAGKDSSEWAMWILHEAGCKDTPIRRGILELLRPVLPPEFADVKADTLLCWRDHDKEPALFASLRKERTRLFEGSATFRDAARYRAISTCIGLKMGSLWILGYGVDTTLLLTRCAEQDWGQDEDKLCPNFMHVVDVLWVLEQHGLGHVVKEEQEKMLVLLRKFGNPFEKETKQ